MTNLEQLARETRSSIELTRNSKSEYQWVLKRYFDAEAEGERERALEDLDTIDRALRVKYVAGAS